MTDIPMNLKFVVDDTSSKDLLSKGTADKAVRDITFRWKSRTGGFVNSHATYPPWYEHRGETVEREVTIVVFLPAGPALAYYDLAGEEKFIETLDLGFTIREHGIRQIRLEKRNEQQLPGRSRG